MKEFSYTKSDLSNLLPKRNREANKGDFGKVLIVAGGDGMPGAAFLSAKAALMVGAGLVKVYTGSNNVIPIQILIPEAITIPYQEYKQEELTSLLNWAEVILIGCGLGLSNLSKSILECILLFAKNAEKKLIIDGDGLFVLSQLDVKTYVSNNVILTPHIKEFSRFVPYSIDHIKVNRKDIMMEFLEKYNCVLVLKDYITYVLDQNKIFYKNTSGNECMAKAGSGDVLAGVIAGFLGQDVSGFEAACLAVFVHGLSGDYCKKKYGSYSVLASDLVTGLREILNNVIL